MPPTVEVSPEQDADFTALVQPHLGELRLHCYRILGSSTDAEDALQDVLVAAWRGLPLFEGRSSVRTWLYTIATRTCLNLLRAGRRRPAAPVPPFDVPEPTRRGEITWLQPCPTDWLDADPTSRQDARDDVSLAFVTALQHLPPRQLAGVVLCDVLDFSPDEVADILGATPLAVKGLLQRGRARLASRTPVTVAPSPDLVDRFADAFVARDIPRVVALLAEHATWSMPPAPHEYEGLADISAFLSASWTWHGNSELSLEPTSANGQPAFGCYLGGAWGGLLVVTLAGDRVGAVTRFLDDDLWRPFGLPAFIECL
ncbi:RNA polymerase subunit sigma-70 [Cellulomonas sp. URHD0024]|uniref:RNA polymerase subunit sigma-70 n=1 Tax=Cellulomonas sp. URHD0024 TaxID=1302620 RepID=UPI000411642E|nr:RNA polymerase subunit sigma-70 [Cellulomonas sp. URHD0024]